ncbi:hypothetical protein FJR11_02560 [Anabaena sp. UHCC 0187]|uniref:hypothetical protein n=1 Tax=Anabaena sp. UHCC 0187 TaxID=2590018 RepID=UPI0014488D03|nr:hypothetical protein [Anabaena sp. UHCC 0187]MTJ11495.1 hypothetical protein [Anabaena sp. UHCC 0187]
MRILELNNPANFSLVYSNSIPATCFTTQDGEEICSRLTEIIPPVILDKPIISVQISTSVPVGKIWDYAGKLSRVIQTGIGDSFSEEKKALFLGKRNLILFSQVQSDYTISYLPPKWFKDVTIGVYQYDGADTSAIETDLMRIESKIDALSV